MMIKNDVILSLALFPTIKNMGWFLWSTEKLLMHGDQGEYREAHLGSGP